MGNDKNEFNYVPNNNFTKAKPVKSSSSFGKSVFVPFISGALGATLVLGACFGVPQIKEKVIGPISKSNSSIISTSNSSDPTELINLANYSETAEAVAQKVLPSVVGITVNYSVSSLFGSSTAQATGSGIIISKDGYIVTNNHVISNESSSSYYQITEATGITVNLYEDDATYDATVVGSDSYSDLAVLKIEKDDLPAATIGNSDKLHVGEFVMAIGNPLGMDSSVTSGIVSALNRELEDTDGKTYTTIQTDAAINSGNSGGALVNSNGEVIGINTLKLSGNGIEGLGFAIPINSTTSIINQLAEKGKVERPYIGISGASVENYVSEVVRSQYKLPNGVYVSTVEKDSPAEKADIKKGDIITKIEGTEVSSVQELNNVKNKYNVGDTVTLTVVREQQEQEIKVTLEITPEDNKETKKKTENNNNYQYKGSPSDDIFDLFR